MAIYKGNTRLDAVSGGGGLGKYNDADSYSQDDVIWFEDDDKIYVWTSSTDSTAGTSPSDDTTNWQELSSNSNALTQSTGTWTPTWGGLVDNDNNPVTNINGSGTSNLYVKQGLIVHCYGKVFANEDYNDTSPVEIIESSLPFAQPSVHGSVIGSWQRGTSSTVSNSGSIVGGSASSADIFFVTHNGSFFSYNNLGTSGGSELNYYFTYIANA